MNISVKKPFNGWYFQASPSPEGDGVMVTIVSQKYWDENRCMESEHISSQIEEFLPSGFDEVMESTFIVDADLEDVKESLIRNGFEEKEMFHEED